MEQMRSTVEDAEESEPLLAKELFDTARKADEQKIPDALKVSKQLVDLGVSEDAAKVSRQAGQGLDQLREGVERAVKSVLGDETAALKRAESELDDLGEQVDREIADATGAQPPDRNRTGSRPARNDGQDAQARNGRDGAERAGQQDPAQAGRGDRPEQSEQEKSATAQRGSGRQQRQQGENRRGQQGERNGTEQQKEQARGEQGNQQGEQGEQGNQEGQQGGGGEQQQGGRQGRNAQQGGQGGGERQNQRGGLRQLRGGNPQEGQRGQQARDGGTPGLEAGGDDRGGGQPNGNGAERCAGRTGPGRPIRGEGFREWTDRMRDVEELLDDPELRAEAARIRDRVRGEREEYKRHSKEPDWNKLKQMVAEPLNELHKRIAEEIRRRESPDALVPIDRDPVPPQFAEGVRRYYERLGSGQ